MHEVDANFIAMYAKSLANVNECKILKGRKCVQLKLIVLKQASVFIAQYNILRCWGEIWLVLDLLDIFKAPAHVGFLKSSRCFPKGPLLTTKPSKGECLETDMKRIREYPTLLHAMMFPYRFFVRFGSFFAASQEADWPSKKLWRETQNELQHQDPNLLLFPSHLTTSAQQQ